MSDYMPTYDEVRVVYAWDAKAKAFDPKREKEFNQWYDSIISKGYKIGYEDGWHDGCNAGIDLGTVTL